MTGQHIEVFLVDGEPGGLTTAEIVGWTGHVLVGPRSKLPALLHRVEVSRNGTYLLLGESDGAIGNIRCYVGRTENFAKRIRQHDSKKPFWDRIVVISSTGSGFTEGHWGYLEARLVDLARKAERSTLENTQLPNVSKLSEAQASDMEAFIAQLQIVLPVLGVNVLRGRHTKEQRSVPVEDSPVFELINEKRGVRAQAQVVDGEFTMLSGSKVVGRWTAKGGTASTQRSYTSYRSQHEKLVADGSIRVEGETGVLTRDVVFGSPSTAGTIAIGSSCNGRTSWFFAGGTYATWENRGVE